MAAAAVDHIAVQFPTSYSLAVCRWWTALVQPFAPMMRFPNCTPKLLLVRCEKHSPDLCNRCRRFWPVLHNVWATCPMACYLHVLMTGLASRSHHIDSVRMTNQFSYWITKCYAKYCSSSLWKKAELIGMNLMILIWFWWATTRHTCIYMRITDHADLGMRMWSMLQQYACLCRFPIVWSQSSALWSSVKVNHIVKLCTPHTMPSRK